MKEIKILHLFPHLISLYGVNSNISVLKNKLCDKGFPCEIDLCEDCDVDFSRYDLVYLGSGTEDNLLEAVKRLKEKEGAIKESIESNTVWLITGNAMALFGKKIERKNEQHDALGVFDYSTLIEDEKRYTGDVIAQTNDIFNKESIGYINTSCVYTGITNPLFNFSLGANLGNDKKSATDGLVYKNFYATQIIGGVVINNPHFLEKLFKLLTGEELNISTDEYIYKAYDDSLSELKKRLK